MTNDKKAILVLTATVKRLEGELAEERLAMVRFRGRAFAWGGSKVVGCDHTTACLIWGDDGQGGTSEGFAEPLPCNCGALANWAAKKLSEATADKADAEALRALAAMALTVDVQIDVTKNDVKWYVSIAGTGAGADGSGPTLAAAIMDALAKVVVAAPKPASASGQSK